MLLVKCGMQKNKQTKNDELDVIISSELIGAQILF